MKTRTLQSMILVTALGFAMHAQAYTLRCELPGGSPSNESTITALALSTDESELLATAEWAPSYRLVVKAIKQTKEGGLEISGEKQEVKGVTGTFRLSISAFTNWMHPNSKFVTTTKVDDGSKNFVSEQKFLCSPH